MPKAPSEYPPECAWFCLEKKDGADWKAYPIGGKKWWTPGAANPAALAREALPGEYRVRFTREDRRQLIDFSLPFEGGPSDDDDDDDAPDTTVAPPPAPSGVRGRLQFGDHGGSPMPAAAPAAPPPPAAPLPADHPVAMFALLHGVMHQDFQLLLERERASSDKQIALMGQFIAAGAAQQEKYMAETRGMIQALGSQREATIKAQASVALAKATQAAPAELAAIAAQVAALAEHVNSAGDGDDDDDGDDPAGTAETPMMAMIKGVGAPLAKQLGFALAEGLFKRAAEAGMLGQFGDLVTGAAGGAAAG